MARGDRMSERAQRLRLALELHETGVELTRAKLARRYPREDEARIARRVALWLAERPGAEGGDGEGTAGRWPRRGRAA